MKQIEFCKNSTLLGLFGFLMMCFSGCANLAQSNAGNSADIKFPEPDSWHFPMVIESARQIAPRNIEGKEFNKFGLAYSLKELEEVKYSDMPANELQKYADIVTHAYPDAVFRPIGKLCDQTPINSLNTVGIASIAFVSLHAQDTTTRDIAKKCLWVIQTKLKNNIR